MFILWPLGIKHDNVLLFLSDAAPYMVKAGKVMQNLYSKMIHVTCMAHAVHRVAEEIRTNFQDINKLISSVKKVFLKAPYRVEIFKTIAPGIPLPPEPVLTRWGTWINEANYYCEHLSDIKKVILELDKNDSVAIKDAIEQVLNQSLETNLIYLKSNFRFIPSEITQLETSGMLLSESIKCIKKIESLIQKAPNKIGQTIATKMENVILKNNGFKIVTNISEMLGRWQKRKRRRYSRRFNY